MPIHLHIEKWVERARQDYFMLFVKAWIPFNAWYKRECELAHLQNLNDKNCIEHICNTDNTFKTKILALLNGEDTEAKRFKEELSELHNMLNTHIIPSPDNPINFSTMVPGITSTDLIDVDFRKYHYKVERTQTGTNFSYSIRVEEKTTHAPRYVKNLNRWKLEDITTDPDYIALPSNECKSKIAEYWKMVNPKRPLDIIVPPHVTRDGRTQKPPHTIEIGNGVYLVDDKEKIAKVLIQLLYKLRCEIFHGSLDPTNANMKVYEHAYYIQYQLVKELI